MFLALVEDTAMLAHTGSVYIFTYTSMHSHIHTSTHIL